VTLEDLELPITYAEAQQIALVFTVQLGQRLAALHGQYGSTNCVPIPKALVDGRLMLRGDVLTEIEPGGLLHEMWEAADKTVLLPAVEILPWEDALEMLAPGE
jgi:hypothetical protein